MKKNRFFDVLPAYIVADDKNKVRKLGKHFSKIRGRVFPSGYQLVASRELQHVQYWIVKHIPQNAQQKIES